MSNMWRVYVTTFNCAKKFPFEENEAKTAILNEIVPQALEHDIYVFGFQELISTWEASFPKMIAPKIQDLVDLTLKFINRHASGKTFRAVGSTSTGAVGLIAFADEKIGLRKVSYSNLRCGLFNSSLKGSASLCCTLQGQNKEQETFTFICSHLNANEGPENAELRVSNYASIMSACATDFRLMPFKTSHIFFFGDLNFRVNGLQDTVTDFSNIENISKVLTNHEELNKLRKEKLVFDGFDEGLISFSPTYKYQVSQEKEYDGRRTPSWCDRILFKQYPKDSFKILSYNSVSRTSHLQFTDHQAVTLDIKVPSMTSGTELKIPTTVPSSQQIFVGDIADTLIGYVGWALTKNIHYGIIAALGLIIFYTLL